MLPPLAICYDVYKASRNYFSKILPCYVSPKPAVKTKLVLQKSVLMQCINISKAAAAGTPQTNKSIYLPFLAASNSSKLL